MSSGASGGHSDGFISVDTPDGNSQPELAALQHLSACVRCAHRGVWSRTCPFSNTLLKPAVMQRDNDKGKIFYFFLNQVIHCFLYLDFGFYLFAL